MSWYQWLDTLKLDAEEFAYYANRPPLACPNDGEPLKTGPNGELFCPFDGWQYPRDWVRPERV